MKKNLFALLLFVAAVLPAVALQPVKKVAPTAKKAITGVKKAVSIPPIIVKGNVQGFNDGEKIYLTIFQNRKMDRLDSATIKAGKFEMKNIKVAEPQMGYLVIGKNNDMFFDPIYLDGKVLTVDKNGKDNNNAKISGSPANEAS